MRSKKATLSSAASPSFSRVHAKGSEADVEGALDVGTTPAASGRESSGGPPIGTAPALATSGVGNELDSRPTADPKAAAGGTGAEAPAEEAVAAV